MLNKWLKQSEEKHSVYSFKVIEFTEDQSPCEEVQSYLSKELLKAYRDPEFFKLFFQNESEDKLIEYLRAQIFASPDTVLTNNVRRGDWGEVLASCVASLVYKLQVSPSKLQWKTNKDKSMFCTDLFTHNSGENITDIHYWEIKTRKEIKKEEGYFICYLAHKSLLKDESSPTEGIANFLMQLSYKEKDYISAAKYGDIVKNPSLYNKNFEICIIAEQNQVDKIPDALKELSDLPPVLQPLRVTIVCIKNLATLIEKTFTHSEAEAIKYVYQN